MPWSEAYDPPRFVMLMRPLVAELMDVSDAVALTILSDAVVPEIAAESVRVELSPEVLIAVTVARPRMVGVGLLMVPPSTTAM